MKIYHSPECYDDAHCDCIEDFEPSNYILDVISMWFPGYTETNPQYKVVYIEQGWTSRTFRIETTDGKFIKNIRVSVDIEEVDNCGNPKDEQPKILPS